MWREIKKIISNNHFFLITTHVNPDGDGIGAATALIELLVQMGKNVRFVTESKVPEKYNFLDFHKTFESFDERKDYQNVQVVFVLDTHKKERIGRVAALLENRDILTICIDHHEPTDFFTPYTAIDPQACCVGAMVYTLYKECGFDLNYKVAMGIYTSIICDTGRFSYPSTNRKAHKIADECIKMGVNPNLMHMKLFQQVSLAELKMFANSLQHMEICMDNKVLIQQIYVKDCYVDDHLLDIEHLDLEYILDFNKMIGEVECIILLRELDQGKVRVSVRSKTDLDIKPLVKALGGGGHSKAAGVTCAGSISEVKNKILSLLQDLLIPKETQKAIFESRSV